MITRESWNAGLPTLPRPLVMGVVNVTPDSFSDGGRYVTTEAAIAHGAELREQGADLLDIGGESTRPGATRPLAAEELDRVVPVIRALAADGVAVSVDTMRHEVASAALEASSSTGMSATRRAGMSAATSTLRRRTMPMSMTAWRASG